MGDGEIQTVAVVSGWETGQRIPLADPKRCYLIDSGPSERGTHRLMTFLHCPTLFAYLYRLDLAPDGRRPLVLGSLVHTGLAHYYARIGAAQASGFKYIHTGRPDAQGKPVYEPPVVVTNPDLFYLPEEAVELAAQERIQEGGIEGRLALELKDQAKRMVQETIENERKRGRPYQKVVSVELPVELRMTHTTTGKVDRVTTKLDLVVEVKPFGSKDLKLRVVDHKTAARPGDHSTVDKYALTLQLAVMRKIGKLLFRERYDSTYLHLIDSVGGTGGRMLQPEPGPHLERKAGMLTVHAEADIERLDRERPDYWAWPMAANEQSCRSHYNGGRCEGWKLCLMGRAEGEFVRDMKEKNR